jgi:hypothetical protein
MIAAPHRARAWAMMPAWWVPPCWCGIRSARGTEAINETLFASIMVVWRGRHPHKPGDARHPGRAARISHHFDVSADHSVGSRRSTAKPSSN